VDTQANPGRTNRLARIERQITIMKTQDARWLRIRDLFEQAVELPPEKREEFLDRHCRDDNELREELKALLAADQPSTHGPLTGAIGDAVNATTTDKRQELVGTVIGPYRLSQILGHGGAGTVYLAERVDRQYSAQVAIKVVEGAALHTEISRRFRSERQILANLNHPNIARLIDAGEMSQGYPYLVMEYVHGEPIDKYCDRLKLNIEQRIELMLKVCSAAQYAHQNLVVHRDIKPANILVTPDGTPKLLDFGIAKLLDTQALEADAALTRMNDRVLTPEYASPEQILGQPVTTASDVYALGVVLYELLAGFRPYKVSSVSQLELERTICILEPAKPSSAIRQAVAYKQVAEGKTPLTRPRTQAVPLTLNIQSIAQSRSTQPQRLVARMGGDLDAILLRALRKEPIYRFESVEQFAADLKRHLNREPVLARQGNWFYYARRFSRRHAAAVGAATAFILLLVGAVVVTSIQAQRIAHERDNANREKQTSDAVANFMLDVFAASDPFQAQGKDVSAKELLDKATEKIEANLNQEPAVKAQLLDAMGRTYSRQGQPQRGVKLLQDSLDLRRSLPNSNEAELVPSMLRLAKARSNSGDDEVAQELLLKALQILESTHNTRSYEYEITLNRLAISARNHGDYDAAFRYHERSIAAAKDLFGTHHTEYAGALSSYGETLISAGKLAEAEKYTREGARLYRELASELDPDRLFAERQLAITLYKSGKFEEAIPIHESVYRRAQQVFGADSAQIGNFLVSMISIRIDQQRLTEAEAFARKLEAIQVNRLGENHSPTAAAYSLLGEVLWREDKLAEAEVKIRKALVIYKEMPNLNELYAAAPEYLLAEVYIAKKKYQTAVELLTAAMSHLKRTPANDWRVGRIENTLGYALWMSGRTEEAKSFLENGYKKLSAGFEAGSENIRLARMRLREYYSAIGSPTNM
jgi:eukaryotic-like serine/threonine-protein kinase